jgi:hypothetical protein
MTLLPICMTQVLAGAGYTTGWVAVKATAINELKRSGNPFAVEVDAELEDWRSGLKDPRWATE